MVVLIVLCLVTSIILQQRMMATVGMDEGQTSKSPEGGLPSKGQLSDSCDEEAKTAEGDAEDLERVIISMPSPDGELNDGCDEARKGLFLARKSAAPTFKAADKPFNAELHGAEAEATKSCGVWI